MRISNKVFPLIVLSVFLGVIGISIVTGYWQTSRSKGFAQLPDGSPDPADIRGWRTIQEVITTFNLNRDEFYQELGLGKDISPETMLKDVEKDEENGGTDEAGFSVELVREYVADKIGQKESSHTLQQQETPLGAETNIEKDPKLPGNTAGAIDIRGSTTLQEIINTGVPLDYLQRELSLPDNVALNVQLKDIAETNGFTVNDVREVVSKFFAERK